MHTEVVAYEADCLSMRGHLYVDDGGYRRPGVLVFPEAFGLSEHARAQAERLALLGYVSLACDLLGEGHLMSDRDTHMAFHEGKSPVFGFRHGQATDNFSALGTQIGPSRPSNAPESAPRPPLASRKPLRNDAQDAPHSIYADFVRAVDRAHVVLHSR
jgi:Dienelactone hydrolase family